MVTLRVVEEFRWWRFALYDHLAPFGHLDELAKLRQSVPEVSCDLLQFYPAKVHSLMECIYPLDVSLSQHAMGARLAYENPSVAQ